MTPQEAMVQALEDAEFAADHDGDWQWNARDILAALPEGTALVTVETLAEVMSKHVLAEDYYITEPDTPFGPEETWFDSDSYAEAILAAHEAKPCCDCRIHVDGICKHHDRLEAPSDD